MTQFTRAAARRPIVVFSICASAVIAARLSAADIRIKPGDQVVRVDVQTPAQLQTLDAMDLDIWSHEYGVGPIDIHASAEERQALTNAGFTYNVLIADLVAVYTQSLGGGATAGADPFTAYMPLPDMIAFLNSIAAARPDLCQVIDIGDSIEGRDIWAIKITGPTPGPKPAVFYHALQHAREWISGPVVLYLANHLVNNYDTDPCIHDLVDHAEFYLAPCVNPDGYTYTWIDQSTRLWRKNRRDNGDGSFGVDNNRNWAYGWGGGGSSGMPSNETYHGTAPFSEPETAALSGFVAAHPNVAAYMDYHSYSQLVMWPFGTVCTPPPEPDASTFQLVGDTMRDLIFDTHGVQYVAGPICPTLYQASGASVDWVYADQQRTAFTIELRPTGGNPGFLLPPAQIIPVCEENLPAILYLSRWATSGLLLDIPSTPSSVPAGQPTAINVTITPRLQAYVPNSGILHYRVGTSGAFTATPLTPAGGDTYTATLPSAACGATLQYYVTAQGDGGYQAALPCGAPATVYALPVIQTVFADNFETNQGWTATVSGATAGAWQRGIPVNDPNWAYDPAADADGSGQCYLTQNTAGNSDVDGGSVTLTSPAIDMTGGGITIEYAYYLNLTVEGGADFLRLEINTNNGVGAWTQIALHTTSGGLSWRATTIGPAALSAAGVTPSAATRLRFTAIDAGTASIVEAGVDAVRVLRTCTATCPGLLGDMNGDGILNGRDISGFIDANLLPPHYHPCADLAAPSGVLDAADMSSFVSVLLGA